MMCITPATSLPFSLAKLAGQLDSIALPRGHTTTLSGRLLYTSVSVIAGGWSPRGSIEISWQGGNDGVLNLRVLRVRGTRHTASCFVETSLSARADAAHSPLEWSTRCWSGSDSTSPAIPGTQLEYRGTFVQNHARIFYGPQFTEYPCSTHLVDSGLLLTIAPRLVQIGLPLTLSLLNDFRTISTPVRMSSAGRSTIKCGAAALLVHELQLTGPGQLPSSLFVDESDRVVLHVCGAEVQLLTESGAVPASPPLAAH